mmetsp:Transcript_54910/g.164409  ORF Transcript_54910/g.164409 Transcript_54910/m.164409 type:complete len:208 (-) Transcript_54910:1144-1767(-)
MHHHQMSPVIRILVDHLPRGHVHVQFLIGFEYHPPRQSGDLHREDSFDGIERRQRGNSLGHARSDDQGGGPRVVIDLNGRDRGDDLLIPPHGYVRRHQYVVALAYARTEFGRDDDRTGRGVSRPMERYVVPDNVDLLLVSEMETNVRDGRLVGVIIFEMNVGVAGRPYVGRFRASLRVGSVAVAVEYVLVVVPVPRGAVGDRTRTPQ